MKVPVMPFTRKKTRTRVVASQNDERVKRSMFGLTAAMIGATAGVVGSYNTRQTNQHIQTWAIRAEYQMLPGSRVADDRTLDHLAQLSRVNRTAIDQLEGELIAREIDEDASPDDMARSAACLVGSIHAHMRMDGFDSALYEQGLRQLDATYGADRRVQRAVFWLIEHWSDDFNGVSAREDESAVMQ